MINENVLAARQQQLVLCCAGLGWAVYSNKNHKSSAQTMYIKKMREQVPKSSVHVFVWVWENMKYDYRNEQ